LNPVILEFTKSMNDRIKITESKVTHGDLHDFRNKITKKIDDLITAIALQESKARIEDIAADVAILCMSILNANKHR
jgi:tRNA A-37 threonylcarbamoyl transferase component Bud32